MVSGEEWTFMIILLACFVSAAIFGGIALWNVMNQRTKPLFWNVPLAILSAIAFLVIMFYLLFK
ncbi:hypothetical protein [Shouchella patagoniensis]|uniref:hypothetical protein n=1 Tax=Shouchella patagoniensis TaxID=228576 RepID=UPI0009957107|nr:hypothetical protein [Shouchella patagoniensis]